MSVVVNKIYCGNTIDVLKTFPDESINCCITSPPYWALRDYGTDGVVWDGDADCEHEFGQEIIDRRFGNIGTCAGTGNQKNDVMQGTEKRGNFCNKCGAWKGQLGLEPDFNLYIKHLCDIFDEVKRVLRKDGTCWVNLGDTYSGAGSGQKDTGKCSYEQDSFRKEPTKTNLPNKSLCNIPSRFSIEMQNRGWILRNKIIWHKPNCMPSSVTDRFTVDFEEIFFFVKSKKYWFEQQFEDAKPESEERYNYLFKGNKMGVDRKMIGQPFGDLNFTGKRNKRTVWKIPTQPFPDAHFAVFPEKLVETPIKAGCPKEGIVLDPFMGSGTVAIKALKEGRQFVGIEINPKYVEMANERIKPLLTQETIFNYCVQEVVV